MQARHAPWLALRCLFVYVAPAFALAGLYASLFLCVFVCLFALLVCLLFVVVA